MRIVICDDEIRDIDEIRKCCLEYLVLRDIEGEIVGVTNPAAILSEDPDILILDVEMPGENGIDVKDRLAKDGKMSAERSF